MRIESIESFRRDDNLAIVRIRTDDGVVGIGQTSPYGANFSTRVLHDLVAPYFLGKDPWDLEMLVDSFLRKTYKFPSSYILRALCGVDTAIWDILGKAAGQPVYKLLGGEVRSHVPMYASSMRRDITPEAEGERLLKLVEEQGFRCVKIRVGQVMGRDADAAPGRTPKLIKHIREVLGDDVDINADGNSCFSVGGAIRVGRMLEEHGYFHFEEPCPYPQIENTAKVAAALDIPVAGGEQDNVLEQFHRIIESGAVDIVQPDVGYIGGISRARRVAWMAEAAGIPCTPHCANRSLLQVFTLHLAAAMPAISQYQEWTIEDNPWVQGIYEPVPEVVDGAVAVTRTPGWGVELVPSFLVDAEREESRAA